MYRVFTIIGITDDFSQCLSSVNKNDLVADKLSNIDQFIGVTVCRIPNTLLVNYLRILSPFSCVFCPLK